MLILFSKPKLPGEVRRPCRINFKAAFAWGSFLVVPLAAHVANVYRQWGFAAALLALFFTVAFVEATKGARAWFKGRMDE